MSPWVDLADLAFLASAACAVASSVMVIRSRSMVYSALFLGMVGAFNAALFAELGFTAVAVFQLAVYVGAAVTFIIFSVVMMREAPPVEAEARGAAVFTAILIFASLALLFRPEGSLSLASGAIPISEMASAMTERYWFALLVAAAALAATMIEALALARREAHGGGEGGDGR